MIYLIIYVIGWLIAVAMYLQNPQSGFLYQALLAHLVFTTGFFGLFNFIGHVIKRKMVAEKIGWVSNGFQIELGFVSMGIGFCGILCYWFRDGFWLATIIPLATFLMGAGIMHIVEMVKKKNFNVGNTWIVLPDFLIPVTLTILYILT